jgi:hypothetical protein
MSGNKENPINISECNVVGKSGFISTITARSLKSPAPANLAKSKPNIRAIKQNLY